MSAIGLAHNNVLRERDNARAQRDAAQATLDTLVSRLRQFQREPEGSWDDDDYGAGHETGRAEGWNAALDDIEATLKGLGL